MRSTKLTIDTSVLAANLREIEACTSADVMAVVKADAYGHGAAPAARALLEAGAKGLAVAIAEEALELRAAGIEEKVLVIGAPDSALMGELVYEGVSFTVYSEEALKLAQSLAAEYKKCARVHLKVDTGMRRIGVDWDALSDLLDVWDDCPDVRMEGVFSHFAAAGEDQAFTREQARRFNCALDTIYARGYAPVRHIAASSAMANLDVQFDMVRAGIALYGTGAPGMSLTCAQTLSTMPVRIFWIREGETVGYGRTFHAARDTRIATLPVGYGDGYPRILGGRADVLVCGKRAPIVGRVCMDMLMVDVTDIPEVSMDSPFVLLGAQGSERITPDELAEKAMTIPYEIMLGFSPRVRWEYAL